MHEVATREIPARSVLCLKRNVDQDGAWDFGKEFVCIPQEAPAAAHGGRRGSGLLHLPRRDQRGQRRPGRMVAARARGPGGRARGRVPELALRTEPAHEEAFAHLGAGNQIGSAQWQLVSESLRAWGMENLRQASELGVRLTFLAVPPVTADSAPDCDFAVPLL